MKKLAFLSVFLLTVCIVSAQQTQYNVTSGNGNGLRFWNSDSYKIHMGNSSEYKFGPVSDYSIKMNMSNTPGRGWTWGVVGKTPIAALNTLGDFKIAGTISGNAAGGALRVKSSYGYIDVGAQNGGWAHIYTDRSKFIFNKDIYTITNAFSSYNNDLIFKTKGTERLRIDDVNGNVGIGIKNPDARLTVNGDIKFTSKYHQLSWPFGSGGNRGGITGNDGDFNRLTLYHGQSIDFQTGSNTVNQKLSRLHINYTGNVGIGTTTPDARLAVNGNIHTKEVKVDLIGWADYVFKKDYILPTLQQVENHIAEKGHLINIPSAAEVVENGIHLGEMNAKLLEKIEELTLYTIAQEKQLEEQKTINYQLITNNQNLEARLARIEGLLGEE